MVVSTVGTTVNWPGDSQKLDVHINQKGVYKMVFSTQQLDFRRHFYRFKQTLLLCVVSSCLTATYKQDAERSSASHHQDSRQHQLVITCCDNQIKTIQHENVAFQVQRHVYWAQLQICPDKIHNILTNCYDHWEKHQPLKKMSFIDIPVKLQGNRGCSSTQIKRWFKAQYPHHKLIVEELDTVNIIHVLKKNLFDSMSNFYSSIRVLLE